MQLAVADKAITTNPVSAVARAKHQRPRPDPFSRAKAESTRHTYATMMLMAGVTPAFCAKQLGHSVEMFLRTYAKWIDGGQNALEKGRLEAALTPDSFPIHPKKGR
jgi:integrase